MAVTTLTFTLSTNVSFAEEQDVSEAQENESSESNEPAESTFQREEMKHEFEFVREKISQDHAIDLAKGQCDIILKVLKAKNAKLRNSKSRGPVQFIGFSKLAVVKPDGLDGDFLYVKGECVFNGWVEVPPMY